MNINYSGLLKAESRDRKFRKRQKLDMVVDGKSAELLFQQSLKGKKKRKGHVPDLQRRQSQLPEFSR